MASKALTVGSAGWTAATRTLAGGTYSPVLDSTDVNKPVSFLLGSTVYAGRIASVVNANTLTLYQDSKLPGTDGTATQVLVPDMGLRHSYSDYIAEVESLIHQDVGAEKIILDDRKRCLKQAVTTYAEDEPVFIRKRVQGTNSKQYPLASILGAYWIPNHTQIHAVEYPDFIDPPRDLDIGAEYMIYDDGTAQDGSNVALRFMLETPGTSEYFIVTLAPEMIVDETTGPNFPDPERVFKNITILTGALCCEKLAAAYAQSSDATITADVVNYRDKSQKYMNLAKQYRTEYNLSVFGQPTPPTDVKAAFAEKILTTQTEVGTQYLFHTRIRHGVIR